MKENSPRRFVRRRAGRRRAGMALFAVLLMLSLVLLTLITLANVAVTGVRLASRGRAGALALSLAEAGVDDTIDRLKTSNSYAGTGGSSVTLSSVDGTDTQGAFAVSVLAVNANLVDVVSVGTTSDGRRAEVRARVSLSGITFGDNAMLSNGDIDVKGNASVETLPANGGYAHIRANEDITVGGDVDGQVMATGTASVKAGSSVRGTTSGVPVVPFPSQATIDGWKSDALAEAQAGGTLGSVNSSMTITGPRFINGDITLSSSDVVTLQGTGPIYVSGNVRLSGKAKIINRTRLVVGGTFDQSGQSSYQTNPQLGQAAPVLMVFSPDANQAIKLTGGSSSEQTGVVYAMNGGIHVSGNADFTGALIAGGVGAQIQATGNFTQHVPENLISATRFGNAPTVTAVAEM